MRSADFIGIYVISMCLCVCGSRPLMVEWWRCIRQLRKLFGASISRRRFVSHPSQSLPIASRAQMHSRLLLHEVAQGHAAITLIWCLQVPTSCGTGAAMTWMQPLSSTHRCKQLYSHRNRRCFSLTMAGVRSWRWIWFLPASCTRTPATHRARTR
jgi:hypothetical protein